MANRRRLTWLVGVVFLGAAALLVETRDAVSGPPVAGDPPPKSGGGVDDVDPLDLLVDRPPPLVKLTKSQINRIRYMELRGMRINALPTPDRVSVKLPREVVDDFLLDMEGHEHFRGKKSRKAFLKMTAPQKLNVIAHYRGAAYADRVQIKSDPEVFVEFRRNVMPVVQRTCATTGCHGPTNRQAVGFRLFRDPKKAPPTTYANFIILNDVTVNGHPMIDRARPANSLLLTYMLPQKDVKPELRHPGTIKLRPKFQKRKAMGFKRIGRWIAALKHPAEDYGVHVLPQPDEPLPVDPSPVTPPSPKDRPTTQPRR